MSKDRAAVALGKKRWKGKSKEEKAAHARMMNDERMTKTTAEERSSAARDAVNARWAKAKKTRAAENKNAKKKVR